jgi:hypothetical protein
MTGLLTTFSVNTCSERASSKGAIGQFDFTTRGNNPPTSSVNSLSGLVAGRNKSEETHMAHDHDNHGDGISRRHTLECMLWAGTGVLWTVAGGIPKSSLMG